MHEETDGSDDKLGAKLIDCALDELGLKAKLVDVVEGYINRDGRELGPELGASTVMWS